MVGPTPSAAASRLTVQASFGAVTWIFQSGHLAGLLGFTKLGYLDATDPILMLAVIFVLAASILMLMRGPQVVAEIDVVITESVA